MMLSNQFLRVTMKDAKQCITMSTNKYKILYFYCPLKHTI
jgi:hypothetical protein